MTTITPRITRLSIGPSGDIGLAWGTMPDGSKPLYWEAEIEKTSSRTPSKVKAEIYNLSPTSLRFLETSGLVITISAGEAVPSSLCYADIPKRGIFTEWKQPDQVTKVQAAEGQRIFREAKFVGSYPAGMTRSQIMLDLVAAAQLVVGYQDALIPERTFPAAVTFRGTVRDALDMLWASEDAAWWIEGKTLYILGPHGIMPGNAPLIAAETGMHGSPTRTSKGGVEVKTNLLPALRPGMPFAIKSRFATGNYRATKVAHKLNSWGTTWETKISGVAWK